MAINGKRADPPVLILHNLDPNWEMAEISVPRASADVLKAALTTEGHLVAVVEVTHKDLTNILRDFSPSDFIVFNWCEELPGIANSEPYVAHVLESFDYA